MLPIRAPQSCFQSEPLKAQLFLVCLLPTKSRNGWRVTFLALLPHIPALFITSLIQAAAGHRIAAHTVMVLKLSNMDFYQKSMKKLPFFIFIMLSHVVATFKLGLLPSLCPPAPPSVKNYSFYFITHGHVVATFDHGLLPNKA